MDHSLTPYLQTTFQGEHLLWQDAEKAFSIILSGKADPIEISGFLGALAARGETVDEIKGAVKALRSKSVPVDAPEGVIDCCGTGGDHAHTLNISTAVSFILAGCGVPVAKHGNRASSSKSGAADVLEALGLNLDADSIKVRKALWNSNICFLMAPIYNPAIKHVVPIRKTLKARTIFNMLGPLLNPAGAKHQVIGVYDKKWCTPMARVLKSLGTEHAWVVHGADGLDEITIMDKTYVTELKDGQISEFEIDPAEFGYTDVRPEAIKGGDAEYNSQKLLKLLAGVDNPYRDIACLNSAAGLVVAGKVKDLKDGIKQAEESIDSGAARTALDSLIEIYRD